MPYIPPEQYSTTPAYELLQAATAGFIGFDQRLIRALLADRDRTIPDLVRFVAAKNYDDEFILDFVALFHALNTPEAAPFYISVLRLCGEEVPDDLTEAIVDLGAPMLEPLLDLYEELGEEQGGEAAFALAGLGVRDPRILNLLLERLEYDAGDGALMLGLYGDPAAIPHIERILAEIPPEDTNFRHEVQSAIRQIESGADLQPAAAEPFDIYELYPEEAGPDFGVLSESDRLALLSASNPELRADAASSFRDQEYSPAARSRLLEVAQSDADANVRGRAWEALGEFADEREMKEALFRAARESPLEERSGALVALASAREPDPEAMPLIEALYDEPAARAKALEAMWKSLDLRFRPYMSRHLDDPEYLVRHHAILGVGYLDIGSEAERLVPLFEDDDFRHDALLAYAMAVPGETRRSRMKPLFRRIEQLAGGLSKHEVELLEDALDQRLMAAGLTPLFDPGPAPEPPPPAKVGRNDPCPCGSGKKYKKCHGA